MVKCELTECNHNKDGRCTKDMISLRVGMQVPYVFCEEFTEARLTQPPPGQQGRL